MEVAMLDSVSSNALTKSSFSYGRRGDTILN